jgi:hypothetical protein
MKKTNKLSTISCISAALSFLIGAIIAHHGSMLEIWMGRGIQIFAIIMFIGALVEIFNQKNQQELMTNIPAQRVEGTQAFHRKTTTD